MSRELIPVVATCLDALNPCEDNTVNIALAESIIYNITKTHVCIPIDVIKDNPEYKELSDYYLP